MAGVEHSEDAICSMGRGAVHEIELRAIHLASDEEHLEEITVFFFF